MCPCYPDMLAIHFIKKVTFEKGTILLPTVIYRTLLDKKENKKNIIQLHVFVFIIKDVKNMLTFLWYLYLAFIIPKPVHYCV